MHRPVLARPLRRPALTQPPGNLAPDLCQLLHVRAHSVRAAGRHRRIRRAHAADLWLRARRLRDGRGPRIRVARRAPHRGGRDVLRVPAKLRRRYELARGVAHHRYAVGGVHGRVQRICVGELLKWSRNARTLASGPRLRGLRLVHLKPHGNQSEGSAGLLLDPLGDLQELGPLARVEGGRHRAVGRWHRN